MGAANILVERQSIDNDHDIAVIKDEQENILASSDPTSAEENIFLIHEGFTFCIMPSVKTNGDDSVFISLSSIKQNISQK
jgi:hypothetical protein